MQLLSNSQLISYINQLVGHSKVPFHSEYLSSLPALVFSFPHVLAEVDECSKDNVCFHGECINTDGSFLCLCEVGFKLNADMADCEGETFLNTELYGSVFAFNASILSIHLNIQEGNLNIRLAQPNWNQEYF